MSGRTTVKEGLQAMRYAREKYCSFFLAQTPEEALAALWHVSQLVHLLPDEFVREVIRVARESESYKVRVEVCYLAGRWGKAEKVELLRLLENDPKPEVREAFKQVRDQKGATPERMEIVANPEELLAEIFHVAKERDLHRIGQFVMGVGAGGGVLLVLCVIFVIVGIICELPSGLTLGFSYVLGALGIEGILVALLLRWKQRVVARDGK